jgi:hypothetical protein
VIVTQISKESKVSEASDGKKIRRLDWRCKGQPYRVMIEVDGCGGSCAEQSQPGQEIASARVERGITSLGESRRRQRLSWLFSEWCCLIR